MRSVWKDGAHYLLRSKDYDYLAGWKDCPDHLKPMQEHVELTLRLENGTATEQEKAAWQADCAECFEEFTWKPKKRRNP